MNPIDTLVQAVDALQAAVAGLRTERDQLKAALVAEQAENAALKEQASLFTSTDQQINDAAGKVEALTASISSPSAP